MVKFETWPPSYHWGKTPYYANLYIIVVSYNRRENFQLFFSSPLRQISNWFIKFLNSLNLIIGQRFYVHFEVFLYVFLNIILKINFIFTYYFIFASV